MSTIPLRSAAEFCKVRIEELGILDTEKEDLELLSVEVVVVADDEEAEVFHRDPETGKPIRLYKIWTEQHGMWQLGGDTRVVETQKPWPAGSPEEIAKLAVDGTVVVSGRNGGVHSQADMHDFLWDWTSVYSALAGLEGADSAVETILLAIPVAPEETLPVLYAALAQQWEKAKEDAADWGAPHDYSPQAIMKFRSEIQK